jgi:hypothetical protein
MDAYAIETVLHLGLVAKDVEETYETVAHDLFTWSSELAQIKTIFVETTQNIRIWLTKRSESF